MASYSFAIAMKLMGTRHGVAPIADLVDKVLALGKSLEETDLEKGLHMGIIISYVARGGGHRRRALALSVAPSTEK